MALTLLEAAKLKANSGDILNGAVIEMYAGSSDILATLPFTDIQGGALKYNREVALPGVGFRGVNEDYTTSTGVINPLTETLVIAGGELDVDTFIVATMGIEQRTVQEKMKVRSLGLAWTSKFIHGDSEQNPREFDGLKKRVTGKQLIAAGNTANGTALSLAKLDEAIDQTYNPTHLLMNKKMRRRFTQAARDTSIGGFVSFGSDSFGNPITKYNELPILTVDLDNEENEILPFTEKATSGTDTATSIYILSLADGGLTGIQNGTIQATDLGVLQSSPKYRTRVEWFNGICIMHGRAVTRLWSIADAPITK